MREYADSLIILLSEPLDVGSEFICTLVPYMWTLKPLSGNPLYNAVTWFLYVSNVLIYIHASWVFSFLCKSGPFMCQGHVWPRWNMVQPNSAEIERRKPSFSLCKNERNSSKIENDSASFWCDPVQPWPEIHTKQMYIFHVSERGTLVLWKSSCFTVNFSNSPYTKNP